MSLTYAEVGATRTGDVPDGYTGLRLRRRVGDATCFEEAGAFVMSLGMQRGAGLRVPDTVVAPGADVTMRLGPGRLHLAVPTRVVYVIDEPRRTGFAYGTLDGHPESGEELFLVERDDLATYAEVRAFSRPGRWFTRLAGPLARYAQAAFARRYLAALERALDAA